MVLALPALSDPALADSWLDYCAAGSHGQGAKTCHQSYSEGLAAVLTGSRSDEAGLWGYIDKQGRMAIIPAYAKANAFQNGLAAVSQNGLWGYIDPRGQWIIKPRFTSATGFNAEGSAVVTDGGQDLLIDRQGKVIKTFEPGSSSRGFLPGQTLAEIEVRTPPRLFNTKTGASPTLPAGVTKFVMSAGGSLAAELRGSSKKASWGLLHSDGRWAVTPDALRSEHVPIDDGDVVAVYQDRKWKFVDPSGESSSQASYGRVRLVASGLWLVTSEDNRTMLLDGALAPLHTFSQTDVYVQAHGDWKYLSDDSTTLLIDPAGNLRKLANSDGRIEFKQGRAWVYDVSPSAQEASDADSVDAGVFDADKRILRQVYTADGKALLDDATIARLRGYLLTPVSPSKTARRSKELSDMPLAQLLPLDQSQPRAILTASGKIVANPQWGAILYFGVTMPLVVHTEGGNVGAIDAQGNWVIAPEYQQINSFAGPYAFARLHDMPAEDTVLIDAHGKPQDVPDKVRMGTPKLDGELLVYQASDESRERRWGLWNVRLAKSVLPPEYEEIREFEDDWSLVKDKGRWGVVNREGQWMVPATYDHAYGMTYLGHGLMLMETTKGEQEAAAHGRRVYKLVNLRTGKPGATLYERPDVLTDGRYIGEQADGSLVLVDAQGNATRVSEGRPANKRLHGDWLMITHDNRVGAIDARGNMKIKPRYRSFNTFFAQPEGLAQVDDGTRRSIINENGKTVLEMRSGGVPLASMQRVLFGNDGASTSIMTDLQGREIARLPKHPVEYNLASEGVVPYRESYARYGFLDANGKRIVGTHFSMLGRLKNGLASAQRLTRTGKLFGYIDLTGRYVIPPAFTWASDFHDSRALVLRRGLVEFIDTRGKATTIFAELCDQAVIFDAEEKQSWPRTSLTCSAAARLGPHAIDTSKTEQP